MNKKTMMDDLIKEIMEKRGKILDDFAKAYLCSFDDKYILKLKKDDFRRLELVEHQVSPAKTIYSFKLKKGVLPKILKKNHEKEKNN